MEVFDLGVPVLGICYGQQVMMHLLGGQVERGHGTAEFGRAYVTPTEARLPLLDGWFDDRARTGLDEPRRPCLEDRAGV